MTDALNKLLRQAWKDIATNDQDDADAMLTILKETLEKLEQLADESTEKPAT